MKMKPFRRRPLHYHGCGCLYVLSNPSFKDTIMKIGFSKDPIRRSKELNTVGLPTGFSIEYVSRYSENIRCIESEIHRMYEKERVSPNREFFIVKDLQSLINDIETLLDAESNISSYERIDIDPDKCNDVELEIIKYFERLCCFTENPSHYIPSVGFYESFLDNSENDTYIQEWKFYKVLRSFYKIKTSKVDSLKVITGVMYRPKH